MTCCRRCWSSWPASPDCPPRPVVVLPYDEYEARMARLRAHLHTFAWLRDEALHDYLDVDQWTLPADWDPGLHHDVEPRPAGEAPHCATLLGQPCTFEGTLIVAHWTDGTTHSIDPREAHQ